MKLLTLLILAIYLPCMLNAQNKEYKPEDTEVWQPVPLVVAPGAQNSQPPSDATVLFDGSNLDQWIIPEGSFWDLKDGIVTIRSSQQQLERPVNIRSRGEYGDIQLHIEWRSPEVIHGEGQRRGNSGIFFQSRYELQIQDNYENATYVNGQAGSIYKQTAPLVNACRKPGEWQSYDVFYRAPAFDQIGLLVSPGYITVVHNGILIQGHSEIKGSIRFVGLPVYEPHGKAPLLLQDHGNAVSFRNIWVREI